MNLREMKTVAHRRNAVAQLTGTALDTIGAYRMDDSVAAVRNCENMIGAAQIPMGVAGPLKVKSQKSKAKNYYIPLATTEGALVASVNRGCKAIGQSGGAQTTSERIGATRAPVFRVKSISERERFLAFIRTNINDIKKVAQSTSHHLTLTSYEPSCTGKYVFVRFVYDTRDAMGLNMATIATDKIVAYLKGKTGVACVALSGNMCTDKKPAWGNVIRNRGFAVWAEVTIPERVLGETLKTSAVNAREVWLAKCMVGSAMAGSMGYNAQFANVVAALFLATGQDPAHVVEGSLGMTTADTMGSDLYVSVYLPDLMVGTVGGGTGLGTQKEALSLLGLAGGNAGKNSQKLAEIVGAAVLAGEISLLASLEEGTLAKAHKALARGNV